MSLIRNIGAGLRAQEHAEQSVAPTNPSLQEVITARTLDPSPAQLAAREEVKRTRAQETAGATRQALSNNSSGGLIQRLKHQRTAAAESDTVQRILGNVAARVQQERAHMQELKFPQEQFLAGEKAANAETPTERYITTVLQE